MAIRLPRDPAGPALVTMRDFYGLQVGADGTIIVLQEFINEQGES